MQYHGTADRYTLNGARAVATLYSNATTATTNPAVTLASVGTTGGQAAAFSYDLRAVDRSTSGRATRRGTSRNGTARRRSAPTTCSSAAPAPDWVNLTKVAIPQADEQQRLLANLICVDEPRTASRCRGSGTSRAASRRCRRDRRRPRQRRHGRPLRPVHREQPGRLRGGQLGVPALHLVRLHQHPADQRAGRAPTTASGFEVGLHVQYQLRELHPGVAGQRLRDAAQPIGGRSTRSVPAPSTNRLHCIVWSDWSSQATTEAQQRHPAGHQLLLLARFLGRRPAGLHDRLRHADALRRPQTAASSTSTRRRRR